MAADPATTLRIAVLLTFEAQMLDLAGIDLFGMLSKEYMSYMPSPISSMGIDVDIYYIGSKTEAKGNLQNLTAQAKIAVEHSLTSDIVQPGKVDILMVPGPPPNEILAEDTLAFVRAHAQHGTIILTVCTGCLVAAQAGILDGRKASAPRGLVARLRKEFPKVEWDEERRYVKDVKPVVGGDGKAQSELWTSGGITNGLEMVAAFIRVKVPGPLGEMVCAMADVGDKGEFYGSTAGIDTSWWIGQVFRAVFLGKRASRVQLSGQ